MSAVQTVASLFVIGRKAKSGVAIKRMVPQSKYSPTFLLTSEDYQDEEE